MEVKLYLLKTFAQLLTEELNKMRNLLLCEDHHLWYG